MQKLFHRRSSLLSIFLLLAAEVIASCAPGDRKIIAKSSDFLVVSAGAGFVVPLLVDIMRMPGLPVTPQASRMDLEDGEVKGLLGG